MEHLTRQHAPALLAYEERNRAHLEPWEPARTPDYYTLAYQEAAMAKNAEEAERGLCARFVAFDESSPEIAACINLWNIRRGVNQAAILGYSVDSSRLGRGYATEAARTVVRYAFDELRLHRLETSYHPENAASGRVLRKLGFSVEGYARDYLRIAGEWRDAILVGLINGAWTE